MTSVHVQVLRRRQFNCGKNGKKEETNKKRAKRSRTWNEKKKERKRGIGPVICTPKTCFFGYFLKHYLFYGGSKNMWFLGRRKEMGHQTCHFWEEGRKKMEKFTNMWKPGFDPKNEEEKQTNERNSLMFAHMWFVRFMGRPMWRRLTLVRTNRAGESVASSR